MKAIVYTRYGPPDVLQFKDVPVPAPADGEVLIKVHATSVNPLDWHFMRGEPWLIRLMLGLRKPKDPRMGVDVAGQVEAVGRNVTQFKPGDEVLGVGRGAWAEYVCASEDQLALKPAGLSFEQAASIPVAAVTALQGLRDQGRIQPGHKVLIDGASGGVGTFAIQIAKSFGAEVTAVCSASKADTAHAIGADHVIDYTRKDFTTGAQRYDLILGVNAYHSVIAYWRTLRKDGVYVKAGGKATLPAMLLDPLLYLILSALGRRKMRGYIAKIDKPDLMLLKGLLEDGKVVPVIDRSYQISNMAEAVRYLEEGHARGKVVIPVAQN